MTRNLITGLLSVALMTMAVVDGRAQQPPAVAKAPTLDLNSATVSALESLPGVGRKTAELIVEYRQKNGGFKKIEELMNVKGIGEKSFLKIKPMVFVAPKTDKAGGDR